MFGDIEFFYYTQRKHHRKGTLSPLASGPQKKRKLQGITRYCGGAPAAVKKFETKQRNNCHDISTLHRGSTFMGQRPS